MRSIRQFFGSRDDVPGWARFFSPAAYRTFLAALDTELKSRRIAFELGEGVVRRTDSAQEYGIVNLAQVCNQAGRETWPALIADHFERIDRSRAEAGSLDSLALDFDRARSLLKIRLFPGDAPTVEAIVRRPASDIVAALVYDLPTSIALVPAAHASAWNRAPDELFRLGLDNVRAEGPIKPRVTDVGGAPILAILGESFFTVTRALFLEEFVTMSPFGAVVAMPHRHAILVHAIEDRRAVAAIQSLLPAAFGMFQEGPGSLSPNLYWWRPGERASGTFTLLPSRVTAQSVEFAPPPEFVAEVLDQLA